MSEKLNIKQWAEEDRPREKLIAKGASALSDAELLAILMGSGNRTETAVALAKRILFSVNNSLHELGRLDLHSLIQNFNGVGQAKAVSIIAAMELGRRRKLSDALNRNQITNSKQAYEYLSPVLQDLAHEEFWVVFLNKGNKVLSRQRLAHGSIDATLVDVRLIVRKALNLYATSIILAHNHPSGNANPSHQDIKLTQKIKKAAQLLDIITIDHIIIAGTAYYSFADHSQM